VGVTNGWGESWSYSYDGLDRLVGVSEPNGVTGSLAYDAAGRLTSLAYRDGANRTLVERAYTYDPVGNRLSEVDENAQTTNYAYDAVDRLIGSADPVQGVVEYSFDAAGNRLTRSDAWEVTAYAYNANNCLTQITHPNQATTNLWYDANGNLVQQSGPGGTTTYTYNAADRLVQITTPTGSESYAYNALGLRVGKADATGVTNYLHDGGYVLQERDGQGVLQKQHTVGLGIGATRWVQNGVSRFLHSDGLGSVVALTDATQAVTDRWTYDAFGGIIAEQGETPNLYNFVGALGVEGHVGHGLLYMRQRYYDPRSPPCEGGARGGGAVHYGGSDPGWTELVCVLRE